MSEGFKVGDLVRRTQDAFNPFMVKGSIYRVVRHDDDVSALIVEGETLDWDDDAFSLVYRPGEPDSWKPEAGDPVRSGVTRDGRITGNVYLVDRLLEGTGAGPRIYLTKDAGRPTWASSQGWSWYGMEPLTTATERAYRARTGWTALSIQPLTK